jgi:hypothetical protein
MVDPSMLTIVIVAGPGDQEIISKNIALINEKNPNSAWNAHVIDNGRSHGYPKIEINNPGVKVHDGVDPDLGKPNACRGSYQHAAALNRFTKEFTPSTPYLLLLDPDFFILCPDWIKKICDHMERSQLSIFGAPWHPKWFMKYRYFPCVHCMFIDTRRINLRGLDFTPNLIARGEREDRRNGLLLPKNSKIDRTTQGVVPRNWLSVFVAITVDVLRTICSAYVGAKQPVPRSLKITMRFIRFLQKLKGKSRALISLIISLTLSRRNIGAAQDTGYLVELHHKTLRDVDTLLPSVNISRDFSKPHFLSTKRWLWVEGFLPDRWSYIPKRRGYYTTSSFLSSGLPDAAMLGWEEFFIDKTPFGFHMRRYNKKHRQPELENKLLDSLLNF